MTGFAKTCIVHTSTVSTLKIHKICYAYQIDVKLTRISFTIPLTVQQISDLNVFPITFCCVKSDLRTMHVFPNPVKYMLSKYEQKGNKLKTRYYVSTLIM